MSLELIKSRRSIRRFRKMEVPQELVCKLLEAATMAPSAGNRQDWFFAICSNPELIREIATCVRLKWDAVIAANQDSGVIDEFAEYAAQLSTFAEAPILVAVSAARPTGFEEKLLGDKAESVWGSACSAAMAAENLMLAASAHGLGSCCMTGALVAENELKTLLGFKNRQRLVCLVALGYSDESPVAPPRKKIDQIARFL